ncbi:DUF2577 family protein [Lacticaseibacillus hulanensis]|uniref:DUF2577 family protein n=1 Tax=Lacticaseibacillus hulanensis TaxID=2493111 RepID=UPI0013E3CE77|nr:DUF2577 family protein [Lacticaseibacillus hulanensis]
MAVKSGSWLIKQMRSRGGHASEYADVVTGMVTNVNPVTIQIQANVLLTGPLIELGRHVTKYHTEINGADAEVDESLKIGDTVAMIREDGGQKFYVFEKVGD